EPARVPDEPCHPRHAAESADDYRPGCPQPGPDAAHSGFRRRVRDIGIASEAAAIDTGRLVAEKPDHSHNESIVFRPAPGGIRISRCWRSAGAGAQPVVSRGWYPP